MWPPTPSWPANLEGTKRVPRKAGREQRLARSCFAASSLHLRALMLTKSPWDPLRSS